MSEGPQGLLLFPGSTPVPSFPCGAPCLCYSFSQYWPTQCSDVLALLLNRVQMPEQAKEAGDKQHCMEAGETVGLHANHAHCCWGFTISVSFLGMTEI